MRSEDEIGANPFVSSKPETGRATFYGTTPMTMSKRLGS